MKPFSKVSISASRVKMTCDERNVDIFEDYLNCNKLESYKPKYIAKPTVDTNFNPSGSISCTNNQIKKYNTFEEHLSTTRKTSLTEVQKIYEQKLTPITNKNNSYEESNKSLLSPLENKSISYNIDKFIKEEDNKENYSDAYSYTLREKNSIIPNSEINETADKYQKEEENKEHLLKYGSHPNIFEIPLQYQDSDDNDDDLDFKICPIQKRKTENLRILQATFLNDSNEEVKETSSDNGSMNIKNIFREMSDENENLLSVPKRYNSLDIDLDAAVIYPALKLIQPIKPLHKSFGDDNKK